MRSLPRTTLAVLSLWILWGCENPSTIDPDLVLTATGEAQDIFGQPLVGAEVRVIKYWSDANSRAPTPEEVFADDLSTIEEDGLGAALVSQTFVEPDGLFFMEFTGADVARPEGFMDSRGRREVADTVLLVRDPDDPIGRTGVFTYEYTFEEAEPIWDTGLLQLWDADASVRRTLSEDLLFTWRAVETSGRSVDDAYRLVIEPPLGGRRLVLNCSEATGSNGGCLRSGERVELEVSSTTIDQYFAGPEGGFFAWIQADGLDYRSLVEVLDGVDGGSPVRDPVLLEGVWAAGDSGEESLLGTAALDGDPTTRARLSGRVTEIYVKLLPTVITDAGILGALLSGAANGCVEVEFTGTVYPGVIEARTSSDIDWQPRGRFCGENGGPGEVSALVSFGSGGGVTFAWMRLRAVPFGPEGTVPVFREIGEVAVFTQR